MFSLFRRIVPSISLKVEAFASTYSTRPASSGLIVGAMLLVAKTLLEACRQKAESRRGRAILVKILGELRSVGSGKLNRIRNGI